MTRTVLYARVSTTDQTIEHQKAQAEAAGFILDDVIEDHGVSGVQTSLAERDNGKRLFDLLRDGDVLVVRWVDRLGRNYDDIQQNIRLFLDRGVTIRTVINTMTFDAKPQDAMSKALRDAMLSFMSAMAEAQAIAMKEAQAAGIAHAKANKSTKYRGRKPSYTCREWYEVVSLREQGFGVNETARRTGLNKFLVSRISNNQEKTFEALKLWKLLPEPDTGHDMEHKFKEMAYSAKEDARRVAYRADKKITSTGFIAKYPQVTEDSEGYLYH
jgi:putative DNA-invertase from lambdoid prophage Rac